MLATGHRTVETLGKISPLSRLGCWENSPELTQPPGPPSRGRAGRQAVMVLVATRAPEKEAGGSEGSLLASPPVVLPGASAGSSLLTAGEPGEGLVPWPPKPGSAGTYPPQAKSQGLSPPTRVSLGSRTPLRAVSLPAATAPPDSCPAGSRLSVLSPCTSRPLLCDCSRLSFRTRPTRCQCTVPEVSCLRTAWLSCCTCRLCPPQPPQSRFTLAGRPPDGASPS